VFHEDERNLFENNKVNDNDDPALSTLRRRDRHQLNKREYHFVDSNILHTLDTGSMTHNFLVGFNSGFERSDFERIRFGSSVTPDISVFDPQYDIAVPSEITAGNDRVTDRWNYGVYAQDVIELSDQFSIMLGARYDQQEVDFVEQVSDTREEQSTHALLPQGGIVYQPNENISVYASYTESFSPNSVERRSQDGGSFDPEEGQQTELGIKASLLDQKLNLTLASFTIEKSNILEKDADGYWGLLGSLESQGVEFELQALPLENWQLKLGYAYVDSIVSDSPTESLIGAKNAFAPKHDAFLWTRYNYPEMIMDGTVGLSLGVNYESERLTNATVSKQVVLPSYTRVDTGIYFDAKTYRLALNITNLLDTTYYTGGSTDIKIYPGSPRQVSLTFSTSL